MGLLKSDMEKRAALQEMVAEREQDDWHKCIQVVKLLEQSVRKMSESWDS